MQATESGAFPPHPLQSGDAIALPIQVNGIDPVEFVHATITGLEDDEPNRRIRMTFYIPSLDQTGTQDVKPSDLAHRLTGAETSRDPVYIRAADLWKWKRLMIDDPDGNGKVRTIRAERGPHPQEDHREILALVVEDAQQRRRPVFMEMMGGLFCEWHPGRRDCCAESAWLIVGGDWEDSGMADRTNRHPMSTPPRLSAMALKQELSSRTFA